MVTQLPSQMLRSHEKETEQWNIFHYRRSISVTIHHNSLAIWSLSVLPTKEGLNNLILPVLRVRRQRVRHEPAAINYCSIGYYRLTDTDMKDGSEWCGPPAVLPSGLGFSIVTEGLQMNSFTYNKSSLEVTNRFLETATLSKVTYNKSNLTAGQLI